MEAPLLDAISSGEMQGVRVEAAERIELVDVQDDEVLARKCDQPVTAQALKPGSRELLENADLPAKLDHMPRT
jgi:hypothetical protein